MPTATPSAEPTRLDGEALRNLRRESVTALTVPIAIATMEGGFVGVVADKVFDVHPGILALITAAPMFGNLSSFMWARLSTGRPKVPFIVWCQISLIGIVASMAFLPAGEVGGWLLAVAVVASRMILSGIITVRSTVWRLNYPRYRRGRVTSRLVLIASLTIMLAALGGSIALDANPNAFRVLYPAAAVLAIIGIVSFSRVRVRDETHHLAQEMGTAPADNTAEDNSAGAAGHGMWSVLRDDPLFRRYMACQFLLGVGNMMIQAPLIYLVSRELDTGYFVSIGLIQVVPLLLATLTMRFWGRYLDRVHIAEFRKYQTGVWMASHLATWLGAVTGSIPLIGIGRAILGVGRGGGAIAWQIGHNDFAGSHVATLYMGVHATLTGVRGAFAPFVGMLLYVGWQARAIPGLDWELPAFAGIGATVFIVAAAFNAVAGIGFVQLHRHVVEHTPAVQEN